MQRLGLRGLRRSLLVSSYATVASKPRRMSVFIGLSATVGGLLGYCFAQSFSNRHPPELDIRPRYGSGEDLSKALDELRNILREDQICTQMDVLIEHGSSHHHHHPSKPHRAVLYPNSTEDVVGIANTCRKYRIPIVPYSGGTSLEGHTSGVCRLQSRD
jgi:D-lactate dehydrogenase (cytochrome)